MMIAPVYGISSVFPISHKMPLNWLQGTTKQRLLTNYCQLVGYLKLQNNCLKKMVLKCLCYPRSANEVYQQSLHTTETWVFKQPKHAYVDDMRND